jgi:hypothetical protein
MVKAKPNVGEQCFTDADSRRPADVQQVKGHHDAVAVSMFAVCVHACLLCMRVLAVKQVGMLPLTHP